jgi:hypothetical protein
VLGTGLLCFVIVICASKCLIINIPMMSESELFLLEVQGGSNMTGTDLCVNKPNHSRSYLNHLVFF